MSVDYFAYRFLPNLLCNLPLKISQRWSIYAEEFATDLLTDACQTVIMKEELSASKVFSSMAVFDVLRAQLWFTFYCVSMAVKGKVSVRRSLL